MFYFCHLFSAWPAVQKIDQATKSAGKKIEKTGETVTEKVAKTGDYTGDYMEDSAITAKIKAGILSDPLLKVSQINVITTNGAVKLSGNVDSQQSIDRAMEIARSVKDLKSVENDLVLKVYRVNEGAGPGGSSMIGTT